MIRNPGVGRRNRGEGMKNAKLIITAVLALMLLVVLATVPDGLILPDAQNAYYIEEPAEIPLGIQPYGIGLALASAVTFVFVWVWLRKRKTALAESAAYLAISG